MSGYQYRSTYLDSFVPHSISLRNSLPSNITSACSCLSSKLYILLGKHESVHTLQPAWPAQLVTYIARRYCYHMHLLSCLLCRTSIFNSETMLEWCWQRGRERTAHWESRWKKLLHCTIYALLPHSCLPHNIIHSPSYWLRWITSVLSQTISLAHQKMEVLCPTSNFQWVRETAAVQLDILKQFSCNG